MFRLSVLCFFGNEWQVEFPHFFPSLHSAKFYSAGICGQGQGEGGTACWMTYWNLQCARFSLSERHMGRHGKRDQNESAVVRSKRMKENPFD